MDSSPTDATISTAEQLGLHYSQSSVPLQKYASPVDDDFCGDEDHSQVETRPQLNSSTSSEKSVRKAREVNPQGGGPDVVPSQYTKPEKRDDVFGSKESYVNTKLWNRPVAAGRCISLNEEHEEMDASEVS